MSWIKGALAGATVMVAAVAGAGAASAASLGGIAPASPAANVTPLVQPVHGYHRRCRWSSRLGRHRHRYGRIRFCDDGPGIYFNFGYYYGPYLYWGPPVASYRGHRRGRRVDGRRHRRGYLSGRPRLRGDRRPGYRAGQIRPRVKRGRVQGNRQFRQFRGKRQLRRKDSALPATIVTTSFQGWSHEMIGTLPVRAA